ncbi:MAG: UbiX family flavin prenyltransferase [Proteobacteria bacterium]|nr:UbiX family flavin prenyltransferase [Pseudomonadota bacterium]MCG2742239.1 UbiX family flavin prenyltransferase [Syntrophaceae bacterium]
MNKGIIVGISGASGAGYAVRLLEILLKRPLRIHLIISEMGAKVLAHELRIPREELQGLFDQMRSARGVKAEMVVHDPNDMFAPVASGSFLTQAMVVIPCSMKTLAAVAAGYTSNLLERAADVTLKERRPLVLVIRETPLSRIHLTNMLRAHEAGATIMPASPGFYHNPQTIGDLTTFIAGRVLDHLGIEQPDIPRWGGLPGGDIDEL